MAITNDFRPLAAWMMLLTTLAFSLLPTHGTAEVQGQVQAREVLQRWMKAAEKVHSVEAEFEQLRRLSTVKVPLRKSGKLWIDRTGLFRWQVGDPPQTLVIRGADGAVTVVDGRKKTAQVWTREALMEEEKAGRGQGFAMLQSMQTPSLEDFESRFDIQGIEKVEGAADVWKLALSLKDRKASVFVRQIEMILDASQGTLQRLTMVMRDKSSLTTEVRSHRLNGSIPSGVFKPDLTGLEVIKNG